MIVRLELEDVSRAPLNNPEQGFCADGLSALIFVKGPKGRFARHLAILGLEGCLFKSGDPIDLGQPVELQVYLDELEQVLEIRGTVVRLISSRHFTGVAVRFRNLPFESERMIARWMDRRARTAA